MPDFDPIAQRYDQFRALPDGVAASVRAAIRTAAGPDMLPILEVGAGTGRIGAAFVAAGDRYVGLDPSRPMLDRFAARLVTQGQRQDQGRSRSHSLLVQADGRSLPFSDGVFGAVLLVSVLSGVRGWRWLLDESRRVIRRGGVLVLGHAVPPPHGVDARMKAQLAVILEAIGVEAVPRGARHDDARDRLADHVVHYQSACAAQWVSTRSPRDFLTRHRTGARFAALPAATQDEALGRLADWARHAFGSLDQASDEVHAFEIQVLTLSGA
jgi:ubiquinone/menaquinone biosynthesis C-methylase UbiE